MGSKIDRLFYSTTDCQNVIHHLHRCLSQRTVALLEARIRRKSGLTAETVVSFAPVDSASPHGMVAFSMVDIGSLKRLQSERDRLFNNSIDMFCICGFDGYHKQVNPAWTRTLGWSAEELLERPLIEFVHHDDRQNTENVLLRLKAGNEVYNFEHRCRCKDGSYRWIAWNCFPVVEESGFFAVGRDVTVQRRAMQAIRESEAKLRSIIDSAPFGMHLYRLDENGELIFEGANPAADRILGVDHRQFIGKRIEDAFPALAHTEIPGRYRKVARSGQPWDADDVEYHDEQIWGFFEVHAFQTWQDRMVAAFQEISARKRAEAALRASEARFRVYYESAPMAYQSLDEKGLVVDVNDFWLQVLGYGREEAIGRPFEAFVASTSLPELRQHFVALIKNGSLIANVELELIKKSGQAITVLFFGRSTRDEKGSFERIHCVFHDITERKRLAEELQKAQRLESIGILAAGIAHDFNNLLGGLFGFIEMAREFGKIDNIAAEYLDKALSAFQRARDLARQLLTFSRGGAPLKRPAAVDTVVKNAAELALSGSNVGLRITTGSEPLIAEIDQGQIAQVIGNIVLNARQAMPTGGTVEIDMAGCGITENDGLPIAPGRYIRICIRDQGTGIAPEHLNKIFDPFFTTKQTGSGLGLTTAFSIVKKHQGHISVSSKLREGSVFDIYLPALQSEVDAETEAQSPCTEGSGRILLMDDEQLLLDIGAEALRSLGYDVECALDGAAAVEKYRVAMNENKPFNAVILDLTVPGGMGGAETLAQLKTIDPAVRAILSSGYSEDPAMSQPEKYGFAAVVPKPYLIKELSKALRKVLHPKA